MNKQVKIIDMRLSEDGTKIIGTIKANKEMLTVSSDIKVGDEVDCVIFDGRTQNGAAYPKSTLKQIVSDWKNKGKTEDRENA